MLGLATFLDLSKPLFFIFSPFKGGRPTRFLGGFTILTDKARDNGGLPTPLLLLVDAVTLGRPGPRLGLDDFDRGSNEASTARMKS